MRFWLHLPALFCLQGVSSLRSYDATSSHWVVAPEVLLIHFQVLCLCRVVQPICDTAMSISISINIQAAAIIVFTWPLFAVSSFSCEAVSNESSPKPTTRHRNINAHNSYNAHCGSRFELSFTLWPSFAKQLPQFHFESKQTVKIFLFYFLYTFLCHSGGLLRGGYDQN